LTVILKAFICVVFCALAWSAEPGTAKSVLLTNNDPAITMPAVQNAVSFFTIAANGDLSRAGTVSTGGYGVGGGYFGASRIIVVPGTSEYCIFAANTASPDIVGIHGNTRVVTGPFFPGAGDSAVLNGIGLASNGTYLYATFTTSTTIAAFQVQPGCQLTYLSSVFAVGLNNGIVTGIAVRGNVMVATYGDGSIESFNISGGAPVSNGDQQFSTGYATGNLPNGVDITQDGRFAIFGDSSTTTTVEVSDISSGVLTPSKVHKLGVGWNSTTVRLSPDETMLYVSNNSSGQVTAEFFDSATGAVTSGCQSSRLKGFYSNWAYIGAPVSQLATGLGGEIYVPEFGSGTSYVGVLKLAVSGKTCTLTESSKSPVALSSPAQLLSIAVYPPRPF
jgi:hypothetical protein